MSVERSNSSSEFLVHTFSNALEISKTLSSSRHVLLGNGFSIAYDPKSFTYGHLLDEADFSSLSVDIHQLFTRRGTADFEKIVEVLQNSADVLSMYGVTDSNLIGRIARDSELLKDALAQVLARRHPDHVGSIPIQEYRSARSFLANFERIYSVNYDLLLYWSVMQDMEPATAQNDGFGESEDTPDAAWVSWRPMATYGSQRIFYLHGALHLFDAGTELRKITWKRTSVPLVDQIRVALSENIYPLVVTEGTSREKYEKILHSAYLNHALRSFAAIKCPLFIYGLSLAENDEHILRQIENGGIRDMFIGLYGDPGSEANRIIRNRAELLSASRSAKNPLNVYFFDSSTVKVWR